MSRITACLELCQESLRVWNCVSGITECLELCVKNHCMFGIVCQESLELCQVSLCVKNHCLESLFGVCTQS